MTMKRSVAALFGAASLAAGVFMAGCESTTSTPVATPPTAPTMPMAVALNDSTVRIKWNLSSEDATSTGYSLQATEGTNTISRTVAKGVNIYTFTGLKSATKYTFTVRTRKDSLTSSAISIDWATAKRFTGGVVWEPRATAGSGFNLATNSNKLIADGRMWDICADTIADKDDMVFSCPGASGFTDGNGVFFNPALAGVRANMTMMVADSGANGLVARTMVVNSLDSAYESAALGTGGRMREMGAEVPFGNVNSTVLYVVTKDGNYAKILLKSVGGKVVQGTKAGRDRKIEFDYMYQTTANLPHALVSNGKAIGPVKFVAKNSTVIE
ncbi:MAG: fibronectin type III domain-containing protein [Candidatus Kapabacteria bacterium]|nr:fibronectin type III domain-containing protein [Candidatus Kapabacteria bacterium]